MVAWSFLSLSPACVQRGRGGPRARVSTTFCSLSTKTGRMGKTIMQSHDNTTHDTAVLLFMSEAESEIRRRPCRDVWVIKPYMPYIDGGRASQKGTRTSITDHGSSEKARERERRDQIRSSPANSMGSNLNHDHFHQIPSDQDGSPSSRAAPSSGSVGPVM